MASSRVVRKLVPTVASMAVLASCSFAYGADFDYPSVVPVPPSATVVAKAQGEDEDEPMRGREVVIDIGSSRPADLKTFYRQQFPASAGWREGSPDPDLGGDHLLCLVRHTDQRFDEYAEVDPYSRRFKSSGPRRYIASISRLYVRPEWGERTENRCGQASIWFPVNP